MSSATFPVYRSQDHRRFTGAKMFRDSDNGQQYLLRSKRILFAFKNTLAEINEFETKLGFLGRIALHQEINKYVFIAN